MANLCAKLKQREKNKYRKIMFTETTIYSNEDIQIISAIPYEPGALLEDGEWFLINNVSSKEYAIDLISEGYGTLDYGALERGEIKNIDFIFIEIDGLICFQNISKSKLVSQKSILCLGENFTYHADKDEIIVNDIPDAIYDKNNDILYFRRLESITGIFKGIDQLFKEATDEETTQFLGNDFIQLKNEYCTSKVKTANRKRIALAQKTLATLDADSKRNIFTYIGESCPELRVTDTSFEIGSEDELKMLLYGIEQRFYTTIVGGEKRIANSVLPFTR